MHQVRPLFSLFEMAASLGVGAHVKFVVRFLCLQQLAQNLQACDVFATPYPGKGQIASGTLAYALSAGCAVRQLRCARQATIRYMIDDWRRCGASETIHSLRSSDGHFEEHRCQDCGSLTFVRSISSDK